MTQHPLADALQEARTWLEAKTILKNAKCPACQGLGECDDASIYDISFNKWKCEDCSGSGFSAALASKTAIDPVTVEQAVMAERERCAQIAETLFVSEIGRAGGQAIARAIRALGKDQ